MVELDLPMKPERLYAHPDVRQDFGKVALRRGPPVYCQEQHDNSEPVNRVRLPSEAVLTDRFDEALLGGIVLIEADALATDVAPWGDTLYATVPGTDSQAHLTAVPYYIWCNRGQNPMQVWIQERPS